MREVHNNDIMVSIICNTYNHEKYIADALEGFVTQKTDFAFEALVHDDASTDKTAEIIREYERRYPDLIKPIYETENQYSKHDGSIRRIQFGRAKGKYIALCEGDDYWTDSLKLQKQFDAMESHPQVDMCASTAKMINGKTERPIKSFPKINETRILTPEEVIYGEGGFLATNSLFYRSAINQEIPEFRKYWPIDYTAQIHGSLRGGILCLKDEMSVYRMMASGSWSEKLKGSIDKQMELYNTTQHMLDILNEETNGKYGDVISRSKKKSEWRMLEATGQNKKMLEKEYKEFLKEAEVKDRIKIYIKARFPWVLTLKKIIKRK